MQKIIVALIGLAVIGTGTWLYLKPQAEGPQENTPQTTEESQSRSAVTLGTYTVDPAESTFNWSGKKPLIDGYVNSGTIDLMEGSITAGTSTATGNFTLDMNTLHVGLTAKKPGQEGVLEGHLKGERFFNVTAHPTATFAITKVDPTAQSATSFLYTITGNLTLKGVTHEVSFPATIYLTQDGTLHAQAEFEIDRTAWGLTAGSGSFFDNLGDNLIADEVALSFDIVARKTQ
jgi:polyisoprenoid-binding protein YceI